jgi:hypothetical protein
VIQLHGERGVDARDDREVQGGVELIGELLDVASDDRWHLGCLAKLLEEGRPVAGGTSRR